jgi:hypothetical protein
VRAAALGVIAIVAGVLAATAEPRSGDEKTVGHCSNVLPDIKTLSDPRRNLVFFRPQATTIIAINKRQMPNPTPTLRARGFERHVWRVVAQITDYTRDADGNIRLILFDQSAYMVAAMPAPNCLTAATRARKAILDARNLFETRCGKATLGWRKLGAVVHIDGVGMWNIPRGQRGHARNYAELRPVTRIRLIAGCA